MSDVNIHRKVATDANEGSETFVYFYSFNQLIGEGYIFSMEKMMGGDLVHKLNCEKVNYVESSQSWNLTGCTERTIRGGRESLRFRSSIDTTFLLKPDDIYVKDLKAESMALNELYSYIDLEKMRGSDILDELVLEKYRRFAYPFAGLVLTLIGFSVSTQKTRGGTAFQLGIGLVISFIFVVLVMVGQALVGDRFPAWLAVWYPNIVFFFVGLIALRLAPK